MEADGDKMEFWKLKINGNFFGDVDDKAVIDHMNLNEGTVRCLFGTTHKHRTSPTWDRGSRVYAFRVKL